MPYGEVKRTMKSSMIIVRNQLSGYITSKIRVIAGASSHIPIGFDTADVEPSKMCQKLAKFKFSNIDLFSNFQICKFCRNLSIWTLTSPRAASPSSSPSASTKL